MDWKARMKNPVFWVCVIGSVILTALAYDNLKPSQMTNWAKVGDLLYGIVSNPYLLGLCIWNAFSAFQNPTKKFGQNEFENDQIKKESE